MAISPKNIYPARVISGDSAYPYGRALNIQGGVEGTGTPLEAEWVNDVWGFQQSLLDAANIAPNGQADSVGNSQYLSALSLIGKPASSITTLDGRSVEERLEDLPDEVDAAGTATTLVSQHNSDAGAHPELSEFITAEADRAEASADNAALSDNIYTSISAGIQSGKEFFSIVSPSDLGYLDLYQNVEGSGVFKKTYPSTGTIRNMSDTVVELSYTSALTDMFVGFDVSNQTITNLTDGSAFAGSVTINEGMRIDQNIGNRDFIFSTDRVNTAPKIRLRQEIKINTISGTCNLGLYLKGESGSQVIYYGSNGWFVSTGAAPITDLDTYSSGDSIYLDCIFDNSEKSIKVTAGKVGGEESSFVIDNYEQPEIWILQRGNVNATHSFKVESANSLIQESGSSFSLTESTISDLGALHNLLALFVRDVPTGFDGAPSNYSFYEMNGSYFSNINLTNPLSEADSNVIYVDIATGNDSNDGSEESPFKSIGAAFDLITTSVDTIVKIKGGTYPVDESWRGRNRPAAKLAVVSWDGEPVISSLHEDGLSWSVESDTTYQAAYTESISTVFDSSVLSVDGDYLAVTKVDDLVTCNATVNSYYNDTATSTLYVNLTDGRSPDGDVRAYRFETFLENAGGYNVAGGLIYLENIHFEGGRFGGFLLKNTDGANKITYLAKDCSFKYAGADGFDVDGYAFAISQNCVCAWNGDDGFNYHIWPIASPAQTEPNVIIEDGCIGRWNGRDTEGTNNGTTMHDAGVSVRINGKYHDNQDRNVHDISGSLGWLLGCEVGNSQTGNANFVAGVGGDTDTTALWLDGCTSYGTNPDLEAYGIATNIYTYNLTSGGVDIGTGTIQPYEI